jgi:hypothetical protein
MTLKYLCGLFILEHSIETTELPVHLQEFISNLMGCSIHGKIRNIRNALFAESDQKCNRYFETRTELQRYKDIEKGDILKLIPIFVELSNNYFKNFVEPYRCRCRGQCVCYKRMLEANFTCACIVEAQLKACINNDRNILRKAFYGYGGNCEHNICRKTYPQDIEPRRDCCVVYRMTNLNQLMDSLLCCMRDRHNRGYMEGISERITAVMSNYPDFSVIDTDIIGYKFKNKFTLVET